MRKRSASKPSGKMVVTLKNVRGVSPSKPSARSIAVTKIGHSSSPIKKRRYGTQRKRVSVKVLKKILSNPQIIAATPDTPDTLPPTKRGKF